MSYKELLDHKRTAVQGMVTASNEVEKAVWVVLHRWALAEIEKLTASTVSA